MTMKWKGLDAFVDWCRGNPNDGKTVEEIAVEYVGIDLDKVRSKSTRKYFRERIQSRITALKKRVDKGNTVPFISVKEIVRGGFKVTGYGSLIPTGAETAYVNKTNLIMTGILRNRDKLRDCKKRLTMVQTIANKKKKVGETNG